MVAPLYVVVGTQRQVQRCGKLGYGDNGLVQHRVQRDERRERIPAGIGLLDGDCLDRGRAERKSHLRDVPVNINAAGSHAADKNAACQAAASAGNKNAGLHRRRLPCQRRLLLDRAGSLHCRRAYTPSPEDKRLFGTPPDRLYSPAGCGQCGEIGLKGRVAIHEVMVCDDELQAAIMDRADTRTLRRPGRRHDLDDGRRPRQS